MEKEKIENIKLLFIASIVGILAGISSVIYRKILEFANHILDFFIENKNLLYILIFFVLLIILAFISSFLTREKYALGSGIPQFIAELDDKIEQKPIRLILYKTFGGFVASLGGLSIGREGPSIQIGAMFGKFIGEIFNLGKKNIKILLTAGASAGIAAAFNAPLAGIVFALEEVHKKFSKKIVYACFCSCILANLVSSLYFGKEIVFEFKEINFIDLNLYFLICILGIILGFLGSFYNFLMKVTSDIFSKINIKSRPFIAYTLSFILFLSFPYVLGSGHHMVEKLEVQKYSLYFLLALFFIKLVFSIISFNSAVAGGIFLPILVQGAIIACIFVNILGEKFRVEYLSFFIILSMAGYLSAIVRSPISAIILLVEMTQKIGYFLPLIVVCLLSYFVAEIIGTPAVYEFLYEKLLETENKEK